MNLSDMPIARASDPETSHLAADAVTRSGKRGAQQAVCLEAVRKNPGSTSAELSKVIGVDRFMPARRLPEIEHAGLIRRGAIAECMVTGSMCLTWWPVDKPDAAGQASATCVEK
jgi:hypothetical protein